MDWIAILDAGIVGAIAGAAGALLGSGLALLTPEKLRARVRGVVVGVSIAAAIAATQLTDFSILQGGPGSLFGPGLTAEKFDEMLSRSKEPGSDVLRVIRENDAQLYARIRDQSIELARSGKSTEEIVNEVRAATAGEVATRLPRLSDAELEQVLDITAFQFAYYNKVAPKVCVDLLMQRPAGDIRKYMSDEVMESEIKLNEIVFSSKLEGGPTLSVEDLGAALEPVYTAITDNHGSDALEIMGGAVSGVPDEKICSIFISFFDGVRALPMPRRAHVFRTLSQLGAGN